MLVAEDAWPSRVRLCSRCTESLPSHPRLPLIPGEPLARLRNSILPSDKELTELEPLVDELTDEVAHYDTEIQRLQRVLKRLKKDRAKIGTYLERQKGLSAPIRRLPPDILIAIFARACADSGTVAYNIHPAGVLRSVCVKWLNVTETSPRLWRAVTVHVPAISVEWWGPERQNDATLLRNAVVMATQVVSLSRDEPLRVTLTCAAGTLPPSVAAFRILETHRRRWESLTIDEDLLPYISHQELPALTTLSLRSPPSHTPSPTASHSNSNSTRFSCMDVLPATHTLQSTLPFHQLQHLALHLPTSTPSRHLSKLLSALSNMSALESLALSLPDFVGKDAEQAPVTLPALKALTWNSGRRGDTCLDLLCMPVLARLTLEGRTPLIPLLGLLERSSARITSLSLLQNQDDSDTLIHLLSAPAMSDLIQLSLLTSPTTSGLTSYFFRELTGNNMATKICRRLKRVEFVWGGESEVESVEELEEAIAEMVQSRWFGKAQGERLESVALGVHGRHFELPEALVTLRGGGLIVYCLGR